MTTQHHRVRALLVCGLIGAPGLVLQSCGESASPTKAQKQAEKKADDEMLLALPYPRSSGVMPGSMSAVYDGAGDRTLIMLRLTGVRVQGATQVSGATLYLTSVHDGRVRPADNPEGSVDGAFVIQTTTPGLLAFSGTPGTLSAGGRATPLKASADFEGYTSAKVTGGDREEAVRFRIPTEDLIGAVSSPAVAFKFGVLEVEVSGPQMSDLREFAARLDPTP